MYSNRYSAQSERNTMPPSAISLAAGHGINGILTALRRVCICKVAQQVGSRPRGRREARDGGAAVLMWGKDVLRVEW
jgi:hypothetical protein